MIKHSTTPNDPITASLLDAIGVSPAKEETPVKIEIQVLGTTKITPPAQTERPNPKP